ncbi:hypothetical protein V6N11_035509 [Hibiscus sabdariffa]|uniref:Retrotransposon gag domain-containing protein n=1 Tax=Hibiscus sabdariffa TaxID=183260 RepID=A0ABR2R1A3_9ROSI
MINLNRVKSTHIEKKHRKEQHITTCRSCTEVVPYQKLRIYQRQLSSSYRASRRGEQVQGLRRKRYCNIPGGMMSNMSLQHWCTSGHMKEKDKIAPIPTYTWTLEPVVSSHEGRTMLRISRIKPAAVRPRAIRDHLTPLLDDLNPGIVAPEIQAAHFEFKPVMFNMLNSIGQFGGSPHEDARQHIHAFLEVRDSFWQQGVHEDVLKLKLFPYSLRDRARAWLSGVPAGGYFFNGVNAPTRMMLDAPVNGTMLDKSHEEAFEILDEIANNDYQFPTSRLGSGRWTSGKLELNANDSVSAQLSAITNLLKNLQKPSDV